MSTTPDTGLPSEKLLEAKVCGFFETWGLLDRLAHVEVRWNPRLRSSAGRCLPKRLQIELNPRLLARDPGQIEVVLAHEAAHLATSLVHGFDVAPHGEEWVGFMTALGLPPRVTHDIPVARARRRRHSG